MSKFSTPFLRKSPLNQNEYGESRGEGHKSGERFRYDPADKKAFEALSQVQKDSLQGEAYKYNKPFPGVSRKTRCWEGYEPTPGVKPYEKGSCRKK